MEPAKPTSTKSRRTSSSGKEDEGRESRKSDRESRRRSKSSSGTRGEDSEKPKSKSKRSSSSKRAQSKSQPETPITIKKEVAEEKPTNSPLNLMKNEKEFHITARTRSPSLGRANIGGSLVFSKPASSPQNVISNLKSTSSLSTSISGLDSFVEKTSQDNAPPLPPDWEESRAASPPSTPPPLPPDHVSPRRGSFSDLPRSRSSSASLKSPPKITLEAPKTAKKVKALKSNSLRGSGSADLTGGLHPRKSARIEIDEKLTAMKKIVVVRKNASTKITNPTVLAELSSSPERKSELSKESVEKTNKKLQDLGLLDFGLKTSVSDVSVENNTNDGSLLDLERLASQIDNDDFLDYESEPETKSDLNVSAIGMTQCLRDENLSLLFWLFLKRQYHEEFFSFWFAVEEYKHTDDLILKSKTNDIYEEYLRAGCEHELSMASEVRGPIERDLEAPTRNMFDGIQEICFNFMTFDLFPKFGESHLYKGWKERKQGIPAKNLNEMKRSDTYKRLIIFQKSGSLKKRERISVDDQGRRNSNIIMNQGYGVAFGVKRGACAEPCVCDAYMPSIPNGVCVCSHWPAKHKNLGKSAIKMSDILNDKPKIIQKLMEPGFKLISALCDNMSYVNGEIVTQSLVRLFDFQGRAFDLINFAVSREIRATTDVKQLFREDRISFRILSNFLKFVASEWIETILRPIVEQVCENDHSYEINQLNKASATRKQNLKRIRKLLTATTEAIFKSVNLAPAKLRIVCNLVRKELLNTFPDCETTGLAALLFLRLICPALCSPQSAGLIDVTPNANALRGLVITAKVLQNLSLNQKFEQKDYKDLDDFIEDNYPIMQRFLHSLAVVTRTPEAIEEPKVTREEKEQALEILYAEIKATPIIVQLSI